MSVLYYIDMDRCAFFNCKIMDKKIHNDNIFYDLKILWKEN